MSLRKVPAEAWIATRRQSLTRSYFNYRYAVLFYTMLATLLVAPVIIASNWSGDVIELFLMVNLGAAALGAVSKSTRRQLLLLVVLAAVFRSAGRWLHIHWASKAAILFWIVLAFVAAVNALRFALKGKRISTEHVYAALSAYLLAGHFAGFVYYVVEDVWPGSFLENGRTLIHDHFSIQHSIYFSFVTLSTLGYGDIVPVGPVARGFAVCEAIVGQFYLAVLVARLIGAYSGRGNGNGQE